jgi:hypothetical protein
MVQLVRDPKEYSSVRAAERETKQTGRKVMDGWMDGYGRGLTL